MRFKYIIIKKINTRTDQLRDWDSSEHMTGTLHDDI